MIKIYLLQRKYDITMCIKKYFEKQLSMVLCTTLR